MDTRPKLWHLPLEPYQARYTEFLHTWEQRDFSKKFNVTRITPDEKKTPIVISSGEVLDSVRRPLWAMDQISQLLSKGPILGKIWMSDFFHPGLEALPYSRASFQAFSFCWAQSFDKYDFTTKFISWMRPWEVSALDIYSGVFVACDLLKELITTALPGSESKIHVVGLPFNSTQVAGRLRSLPQSRQFDCVYSSRFDEEKNPNFFLDLVEACPALTFAICTGHTQLRGTDIRAVRRAKTLADANRITVFENCDKQTYYNVLASSKVQFNCALQDWVSFTLLEALTFGCLPLYPHFRAFPETLLYQGAYLYMPEILQSAVDSLTRLVDNPPNDFEALRSDILSFHNGTLSRIANIISEH